MPHAAEPPDGELPRGVARLGRLPLHGHGGLGPVVDVAHVHVDALQARGGIVPVEIVSNGFDPERIICLKLETAFKSNLDLSASGAELLTTMDLITGNNLFQSIFGSIDHNTMIVT